jgi:apolipoprotein N-acyltransferase
MGSESAILREVKRFSWFKPRYAVALLGGWMLAASFPHPGTPALAWLAPGLILMCGLGQTGGMAFRIGYVAGLAHYLASLYWLLFIPFPVGAFAGWLALSAYLALYPAVWVWLCWRIFPGRIRAIEPGRASSGLEPRSLRQLADPFFAVGWWQRARWALGCAVVWVALEMTVSHLLSGFPWNLLGVSQYRLTPLIQLASLMGVYGVSFLVVWFAVALSLAAFRLLHRPALRWACVNELALPLLAVAVAAAWGFRQMWRAPAADRAIRVALIQPSIPQRLIWDHREDSNRFNQLLELSDLALAARPDLLVWPETAMPAFSAENYRAITNLVGSHQVCMIFGADDVEHVPAVNDSEDIRCYNAAFLFGPDGRYVDRYRKQRLVIFGEYVPLSRGLPFLKWLTPIEGGFTAGAGPIAFEMAGLRCKTSVLICFEDVFPDSGRRHARDDVDFLLNLTNDGWFDETAAQWQHAANAVFRAVENGLPLVRCTNNGLTCWIDPVGRIRQILSSRVQDVYGPGFLTSRIPLLPVGERRVPTFYHRHGDWFGWGCVVLAVALLALRPARSVE